jgi:hypothetical protein
MKLEDAVEREAMGFIEEVKKDNLEQALYGGAMVIQVV